MPKREQRFYEAHVEVLCAVLPGAGAVPLALSAAAEFCLAFRDFRETSRKGPEDRPYGWSNLLREQQERMDQAWAVFEREVNKRAAELAALTAPPKETGPELFGKPKRKRKAKP